MKKLILFSILLVSQLSFATARIDLSRNYYPNNYVLTGYQSPTLGDMDQTFLWGLGGGIAGNLLTKAFGGNRTVGTLIGSLIGLYAGYQEDKSENIEEAIYNTNTSRTYVYDSASRRRWKRSSASTSDIDSDWDSYQKTSNAIYR